jgi:hypothetical protein
MNTLQAFWADEGHADLAKREALGKRAKWILVAIMIVNEIRGLFVASSVAIQLWG